MTVKKACSICVLDYGSGNTRSVCNLLKYLGARYIISSDVSDWDSATHLILPGVGSFDSAMRKIIERFDLDALHDQVRVRQKPFLGVCVGMQVMFDFGTEGDGAQGLGWLPGSVERIDSAGYVLPHVGWNEIEFKKDSVLFAGLSDRSDFYFVHSFSSRCPQSVVSSSVMYGHELVASVEEGNMFGVQFHPEKSQVAGQRLVKNFLSI